MRHSVSIRPLAFALALSTTACVAPKAVQPPPPPVAAPIAQPPAPPTTTDWRDIPLTPGDWRYTPTASGSSALFGRNGIAPEFVVRCDMAARTVTLARTGGGGVAAKMAITTSAGNRALATGPVGGAIVASLPARDPFLDKMAFSRGRFVIAVTGTARLVIPAWPEFARVIEDCRG